MSKTKKTLVLDFDGVIHSYDSGWKGIDVVSDGPVPGAVQFILEAQKTFTVMIYSSRSESPAGIKVMSEAIFEWIADETDDPTAHHAMDGLQFPTTKPPAFLSIDDRALTFTGLFPSIEELSEFQPWNKKAEVTPYALDTEMFRETPTAVAVATPEGTVTLDVDDESGAVRFRAGVQMNYLQPGDYVAIRRPDKPDRLAKVFEVSPVDGGYSDVVAALPVVGLRRAGRA